MSRRTWRSRVQTGWNSGRTLICLLRPKAGATSANFSARLQGPSHSSPFRPIRSRFLLSPKSDAPADSLGSSRPRRNTALSPDARPSRRNFLLLERPLGVVFLQPVLSCPPRPRPLRLIHEPFLISKPALLRFSIALTKHTTRYRVSYRLSFMIHYSEKEDEPCFSRQIPSF